MQESPTCKLLYVTPEQLVRNGTLHDLLAGLHRRGRLARLVVDEVPSAHRLQTGVVASAHAALHHEARSHYFAMPFHAWLRV